MDDYTIGIDLAPRPDKTAYVNVKVNKETEKVKNEIYSVYGLSKEQVETKENNELLATFLELNNGIILRAE